ncbi:carbohydrate ABC transporter substrate-binding protein (plasmid) [Labrenzia sp. 5N]|uniref:carbohydrate ABC transporter substrate-binding protein n=1 Tax=Labrenzia sp. 5N TaxID=2723402 RepID=UPI001445A1EB|nr:carbohydrate ABC transporter substrate-binding protein [Labrenzia sp. 5N]NKX68108.1 carbohydrate ABC transporter substrate-binding protein [Labrenzia sp. 5N]
MSAARLKGMTWSHPRGYEPMVACSKLWEEQTGVGIDWDKRSLQDFESYPVEDLARQYDLIVIDHPHVGEITTQNCLAPLDRHGDPQNRQAVANGSVGGSYESYFWEGHQWAYPIDAAAQIQAYRADLVGAAPTRFDEVLELAEAGKVLIPMRPPHSLMTFFTLSANLGTPCTTTGPGELVSIENGAPVYELISHLMRHVPDRCYGMDPIAVFEEMCKTDSPIACVPLIYGYVNYGIEGFRPKRLSFADIPAAGDNGPMGSALGGTGIAVSAFSNHVSNAADFALWIASGPVQRGPFAAAGGQPGHADGWSDETVNDVTNDFYRNTRRTLDNAWVRPRHKGYMAFQAAASERLNLGLQGGETAQSVIGDINALFAGSFE